MGQTKRMLMMLEDPVAEESADEYHAVDRTEDGLEQDYGGDDGSGDGSEE